MSGRLRYALRLHPDCRSEAVGGIEVEVARSSGLLHLTYRVTGRIADLRLRRAAEPRRRDRLWKQSCFEAFIGTPSDYLELNLSPSRAWAAYRFDGYRSGMRDAGMRPPSISADLGADRFELRAEAEILRWEGRLGLAAIVEEKDGHLSYWALNHPEGAPDFHHPCCFDAELPSPAAA